MKKKLRESAEELSEKDLLKILLKNHRLFVGRLEGFDDTSFDMTVVFYDKEARGGGFNTKPLTFWYGTSYNSDEEAILDGAEYIIPELKKLGVIKNGALAKGTDKELYYNESLEDDSKEENIYVVYKDNKDIENFVDKEKAIKFAKDNKADKVTLAVHDEDAFGNVDIISEEPIWTRKGFKESLQQRMNRVAKASKKASLCMPHNIIKESIEQKRLNNIMNHNIDDKDLSVAPVSYASAVREGQEMNDRAINTYKALSKKARENLKAIITNKNRPEPLYNIIKRDRIALDESLFEDVVDDNLSDYEPGESVAEIYNKIKDNDKVEDFKKLLNQMYPDGFESEAIDTLLSGRTDWVYSMLGISDEENK